MGFSVARFNNITKRHIGFRLRLHRSAANRLWLYYLSIPTPCCV